MPISPLLRSRLAKPFGEVLDDKALVERLNKTHELLVAVGDQTLHNLLQAGAAPDIGIFDGICQRKPIPDAMRLFIEKAAAMEGGALPVDNPPGTITQALEETVVHMLSLRHGWILINGEDDLASLVVMAHAPRGAVLVYGQPNEGAVWVDIDDRVQRAAREILSLVKKECAND